MTEILMTILQKVLWWIEYFTDKKEFYRKLDESKFIPFTFDMVASPGFSAATLVYTKNYYL